MKEPLRSSGPLYMHPHPLDGWYLWDCPVCGARQSDRETARETECSKGHTVKLAVVGTQGDGYRMCAEVEPL